MQHQLLGVILLLTATFLFAALDTSSKYLTAYYAVPLVVWARYFVHLVLMLAAVAPGTGRDLIVTKRPGMMILRGLLMICSSLLVVLAFHRLPIAETTALVFINPLFVALLAGPLLGEKVSLKTWLATLAGFGGVLLIARPGGSLSGIGIVYALGCAVCYAGYQILTRKLSETEPAMRQLFYGALIGTVVMTCVIPAYWTGTVPTLKQGLIILSLGLFGGGGHFLLIRAFRVTQASTLSPLLYVQLVWVTLLGWIVFGQLPDLPSAIGMTIIGASCLSLALRGRSGRRPSAPGRAI